MCSTSRCDERGWGYPVPANRLLFRYQHCPARRVENSRALHEVGEGVGSCGLSPCTSDLDKSCRSTSPDYPPHCLVVRDEGSRQFPEERVAGIEVDGCNDHIVVSGACNGHIDTSFSPVDIHHVYGMTLFGECMRYDPTSVNGIEDEEVHEFFRVPLGPVRRS